jgi:hypothetical protein
MSTITGTHTSGVVLSNPTAQNPATIASGAYISNTGSAHGGTALYGDTGTDWYVFNVGTIVGTYPGIAQRSGPGIYLKSGGNITNATSAQIIGYGEGVKIDGVLNSAPSPGRVTNLGTIAATANGGIGVYLVGGGYVANGQSSALITGQGAGVAFYGAGAADVVNSGTITGYLGTGVDLEEGGTVVNRALITGDIWGISAARHAGTIGNYGQVLASSAAGVQLLAGGIVTNGAGALIEGQPGISISGGAGTVINSGTIVGTHGDDAIQFGTANDLLILDPGSVFVGKVDGGGGNNRVKLRAGATTGTLSGLGTQVVNFGTVVFNKNASWQVNIHTPTSFTGTLYGFAPTDSLDLTTVAFSSAGTVKVNGSNVLVVSENGTTYDINLDPSQSFAGDHFHLSSDGSAGTLITETSSQQTSRDFNGNGTSDVLFQSTDGNLSIWLMSGATVAASSIFAFAAPSVWSIRGTGDFDGDGKADILWQDTSGNVSIWEMNGAAVASSALAGFADPSWHIRATGDFNGDGKSDILFQNDNGNLSMWQMNGEAVASSSIFGFADPSWHIRGVGDFNDDGRSDILWQNDNGNVSIWEMNGATVSASGLPGFADATWHIRGTGDFNGDGKSDILWQNDNGNLSIWEMNGLSVAASSIFGFADPSVWHIAGVGDYNGDGKSDILWGDTGGNVAVWQMNGFSVAASALAGFADPSWHIVPPDSTGDIAPA